MSCSWTSAFWKLTVAMLVSHITTKDLSYEVVAASTEKAHLILRTATRVRSDGSAIETVSAFGGIGHHQSG
jgi:hypothetical protein